MSERYDDYEYVLNAKDYTNLYDNSELRAILKWIIALHEPNRQYRECQIFAEAINIRFLRERGVPLRSSDIIVIDQEYQKFDYDLSNLTTKINGLYNIYDEQGAVDHDDVDYLLFQIDKLYSIMNERYGGIGEMPPEYTAYLGCSGFSDKLPDDKRNTL